jgi:arylamine N-acetyltransferase
LISDSTRNLFLKCETEKLQLIVPQHQFSTNATMSHPTYTTEQVHQIYDRIRLPQKDRHSPSEETKAIARGDGGLELLSALQRHHLANVPFENLELHYSPKKEIKIDPELLFQKIVTQNTGRGGYCMENNLFFGTLLRTLGFAVMSTGGRVNTAVQPSGDIGPEEHYTGWSHMVNIVTIQGQRYMVDVGFGTGQATHPLPLVDRSPSMNVRPSRLVRLRWDAISEAMNKDAKLWIFERQDKADGPWIPTYCFPDNVEYLAADYAVMSYFTSTNSMSFFTNKLITAKFVLGEAGEEIVGTVVMFGNKAHKRILGEKEELGTFEKEEERVKALEEYFDLRLSEAQKAGIRGMVSAI